MSPFKNYLFRWFATGFLIGAAFPVLIFVFASDAFKDFQVQIGSIRSTGTLAQILIALYFGIFVGVLGFGAASLRYLSAKKSN